MIRIWKQPFSQGDTEPQGSGWANNNSSEILRYVLYIGSWENVAYFTRGALSYKNSWEVIFHKFMKTENTTETTVRGGRNNCIQCTVGDAHLFMFFFVSFLLFFWNRIWLPNSDFS